MSKQFSFSSTWKFNAPVELVWAYILQSENWPQWWKYVREVKELREGDDKGIGSIRRYTFSCPFRYRLTFDLLLQERQEYVLLQGTATGDLQGTGSWLLSEKSGVTTVTCYWNVKARQPWMKLLSPLLEPLFSYNHAAVMKEGAEALAGVLSRHQALNTGPATRR